MTARVCEKKSPQHPAAANLVIAKTQVGLHAAPARATEWGGPIARIVAAAVISQSARHRVPGVTHLAWAIRRFAPSVMRWSMPNWR